MLLTRHYDVETLGQVCLVSHDFMLRTRKAGHQDSTSHNKYISMFVFCGFEVSTGSVCTLLDMQSRVDACTAVRIHHSQENGRKQKRNVDVVVAKDG